MKYWRFSPKILTCFILPILIMNACAYKRMIFNKLDWLVVYQMDSFLDLTSAQEKTIKIPVHETVAWLKAERLPLLSELLREVSTAAEARKIDARTYAGWVARIEVWREEITGRIMPPLALLLKQLDKDQIEHLQGKLAKSDRKLVKLLEHDDSEFLEEFADYVDEAAGSYTFWFGKLRQDQKVLLVAKLKLNRATLSEQLQQRRRVREFWIDLLKKHDRDQLITAIRHAAEPEGSWRDPEYQRFRKEARERMQDFLLALFASLDAEQWQHFEKVIQELVADTEAVAMAPQRSRN